MEIENTLKEYFKNKINNIDVNPDVERAVMAKLTTPRRNSYNKRTLAFVLLITLLLTQTGLAYGNDIYQYIKNMDFFNNSSEAEWSIVTDEEDYRSYDAAVQEAYESLDLEPGNAVAIYVAEANPEQIVSSIVKPVIIQDLAQINSYPIGDLNLSLSYDILNKYQFHEGKITYNVLSELIDIEAMVKEANRTGKGVIVKELPVSEDVASISCEYITTNSDDNQPAFTIGITKWYGNMLRRHKNDNESLVDFESVMIGDSEVLYENLIEGKHVTWINDGYHYQLFSKQSTMTKEELLRIAEQIKQQH
jgi:hypothetical protein